MADPVAQIRKLLELARSTEPHEAALAAERARELILKHNVSEEELRATGGDVAVEPVDSGGLADYRGAIPRWHKLLAQVLAPAFLCRACSIPGFQVLAIGRRSNRQALQYTWLYLRGDIQRLAREACAKARTTNPTRWRLNFAEGAVAVVAVRLARADRQLEPASSTALVLRSRLAEADEWLARHFKTTTKPAPKRSRVGGFDEGTEAGWALRLEAGGARRLGPGAKQLPGGDRG